MSKQKKRTGKATKKQSERMHRQQPDTAAAAIAENPLYFLLYTAGVILLMWAVKWLLF
jgi:Flp pilus assembly protein TadB